MKYILDSLNYIEAVSFEAGIEYQGRPCTLYTGKVPTGYTTLEEWEEKALINAYKIVNNDLVLDETRQKYLENKLAKELEDYTLATHKYVNDKVSLENNLVSDELAIEKSGTDFITLENTKDYSIPKINVDSTEDKEVVASNKNLLSNDLINAGYRGIRLETSEDKSFKLDGKISDYASENLNSLETKSLKADINVDGKSEQKKLQGYNTFSINMIAVPTTIPGQADVSFLKYTIDYENNGITMKVIKANPRKFSGFYYEMTNAKMNTKYTATFKYKANMNGHSVYLIKDGKIFNPTTEWQTGKVTWTRTAQWNPFIFYTASENMPVDYTVEVKEIMIVEGEEEKTYEQYCGATYINDNLVLGQSPSLDYPQEIKVVDKLSVSSINKNSVTDYTGLVLPSYPPNVKIEWKDKALHILPNSSGFIHIYNMYNQKEINESFFENFKVGEEYTIGYKAKGISDYNYVPEIYTDNAGSYFAVDNKEDLLKENEYTFYYHTFQYRESVNRLQIHLLTNVNIKDLYIKDIFIAKGRHTTYSSYVPPKTIDNLLPTNEVLVSLPNGTKDTVEQNKIVKRVGKIVLDGSEKWGIEVNPTYTRFPLYIYGIKKQKIRNSILSNYFFDMSGGAEHKPSGAFTHDGKLLIYTDHKDVASLKKWLSDKKASGNPVVVYYELDMPEEKEIPVISVPSQDAKIEVTTNLPTVTNAKIMEHIEAIELPFKNEKDSTKMLYLLKAGKDYTLSGLNSVTLNMYSYNGIDRELVYTGTGGKINVTADKVITHTSLTLKNANKFNNTIIKPQLEVGAVATEYVEGKQVHSKSTLKEFKNIFRSYDSTTHIMNNKKANMKVKYFLYQTLKNTLASFKVEQDKILSQVKESIDFTRNLKGKELEVVNALDTTVEELKISRSENAKLLLPSTKLYPSAHLFPCTNTDSFTICVDTAPSTKPTANIKKYNVATKIYMLVKGTVKDEVVIKTNAERTSCTVELVQKLQNINGVISELAEPKITKLLEVPVMLLKGTNYIYIEPNSNYNNYALDLTYIYNTELNKLFTNKTEVSSKIEQTKDAINLEVSKKVGKNEIKSAINQSAEAIKIKANNIEFEGTVTANDNFKILPDGSIEAKNGSFSGNILLDDGSTIIGGKGLLSSLQFFGNGDSYNSDMDGYAYVGFQTVEMENRNAKTGIAFNCYVPQNFSILKATMHLTFVPLKVNDTNRGTIHNARLYKQSVDASSYFNYSLQSTITNNITSYLEDTNALSGGFEGDTRELVIDITKNITNGLNRLVIQSGNNPPPFNEADWDGNHYNTAINSGYLSGEVNIIGYLKI